MKWLLLSAWILVQPAQEPKNLTVEATGLKREALVVAPEKATEKKRPLVLVYHGHGGTARNAWRSMPIHRSWPEALVVYPQGIPTPGVLTDPKGEKNGWQRTAGDQNDRDLKFFDELLKKLSAQYKIGDVFVTGHSNGGAFTYLLWTSRPEAIRAIAPSAAGSRSIRTAKPKPVMHIAGRNDPLVKFANQERSMEAVRKVNQCDEKARPWDKNCQIYSSPVDAPFVSFIHDGDHKYPAEAPPLIVKFFKEQLKNQD